MSNCSQCGKPAIVTVGDHPLCVDCNLKFQQAEEINNTFLERRANYLSDQIEATVGLPGILPRYPVRQPAVHQGVLTFNNIKVDNSVIGSINTGNVQSIDVAMSHIKASGNDDLAQEISKFTEAVIKEAAISKELRDDILEQLAFLMSEYGLSKAKRKTSIIKSVLLTIKDTVSTIASLSTAWSKIHPFLERIFS